MVAMRDNNRFVSDALLVESSLKILHGLVGTSNGCVIWTVDGADIALSPSRGVTPFAEGHRQHRPGRQFLHHAGPLTVMRTASGKEITPATVPAHNLSNAITENGFWLHSPAFPQHRQSVGSHEQGRLNIKNLLKADAASFHAPGRRKDDFTKIDIEKPALNSSLQASMLRRTTGSVS